MWGILLYYQCHCYLLSSQQWHQILYDKIALAVLNVGRPFILAVSLLLLGSNQPHHILYDEVTVALSAQDIPSGNIVEFPHFVTTLVISDLRKTPSTKHASQCEKCARVQYLIYLT